MIRWIVRSSCSTAATDQRHSKPSLRELVALLRGFGLGFENARADFVAVLLGRLVLLEKRGRGFEFSLRFERTSQIVHCPESPGRSGSGKLGAAQPTLGNGELAIVE